VALVDVLAMLRVREVDDDAPLLAANSRVSTAWIGGVLDVC
jgi:hypothetical protein